MPRRNPTTAADLHWIKTLIERERTLLGDMLVQLNSVSCALVAEPNDPPSAPTRRDPQDARRMVEAVAGRLKADDERLGVLAQHIAETWNGERA